MSFASNLDLFIDIIPNDFKFPTIIIFRVHRADYTYWNLSAVTDWLTDKMFLIQNSLLTLVLRCKIIGYKNCHPICKFTACFTIPDSGILTECGLAIQVVWAYRNMLIVLTNLVSLLLKFMKFLKFVLSRFNSCF